MKTKMKKKCVKILTLIICMVSIVTALVIVPSANTYDDNLDHYRFIFKHSQAAENLPYDSYYLSIDFETPFYQKCAFIYDRLNGQNLSTARTFKSLSISMLCSTETDPDTGEILGGYASYIVSFDPQDYINNPSEMPMLTFRYHWDYVAYYGLTIYGENLHPDYRSFEIEWLESYGNYYFHLWLDFTYITNIQTNGAIHSVTDLSSIFSYSLISRSKTYSDGYNDGEEDGYTNGYGVGYEGGYMVGNEEGYSDGYDYGYSDGVIAGWENGHQYGYKKGWDNGFGAGQNDMAETTQSFKDMVFAIFDAPVTLIDGMLGFEIFGINMAGLVKTIITLAVVALIVFVILKFAKG